MAKKGNTPKDEVSEKDAAAAEAAAAAEKLAADREALAERMDVAVIELRDKASASAMEVRAAWCDLGDLLNEGAALFVRGNGIDNTGYSAWLRTHGYKEVGQRPTLSAARALADIRNLNPDLWECFPTEGTDLRTSPRTLVNWIKEETEAVFQACMEQIDEDGNRVMDDVQSVEGDGNDKANAAAERVPAINTFLDEMVAASQSAHASALAAFGESGKNPEKVTDAVEAKDGWEKRRQIFDAIPTEDMVSRLVKFKFKEEVTPFVEQTIDEAAATLCKKLWTHPHVIAVLNAMTDQTEAELARLEEEAKAKAEEEAKAGEDESVPSEEGDDEPDH